MGLLDWALAVPWLIVAMGCGLGYMLMRQSDRVVKDLEDLEQRMDMLQDEIEELMPPEPLHAGAEAPAFTLPDLDGRSVSLEDFRGKRVLLVFFSPTCPFCQKMAPELAALSHDGLGGLPVPIVIAAGDAEASREMARTHGIHCPFLLDENKEVEDAYLPGGTPAAYVIDEQGLVARERVDGVPTILALARTPALAPVRPGGNGDAEMPATHAHAPATADPGAEVAAVTREMHAPLPGIPQEGIGVGDLIKRMTDKLGLKPCRGCERRRLALNRWVIKRPGRSAKR